jgi:death-on-curing protein
MTEIVWLDEAVALAVHERSLLLHGGATGIRDEGLLHSGLARPQHLAAYQEGADLSDLAAAYTAGIVKNHPFLDGNKRTGFVVGVLFLELNSARVVASEEAATEAVLSLAAGTMDTAGYAAFLRANLAQE